MKGIEIRMTDKTGLLKIRPLWEELNRHHHLQSSNFKEHFQEMTFEKRLVTLREKATSGEIVVYIAHDTVSHRDVGYCICSLFRMEGEVDSLYVDAAYRRSGIGSELLSRALSWLDQREPKKKIIVVAEGNEEAWKFYRKFGFYPRSTVLEQI